MDLDEMNKLTAAVSGFSAESETTEKSKIQAENLREDFVVDNCGFCKSEKYSVPKVVG